MEWIIGAIILFVIIGALSGHGKCGICEQGIKKKYYNWTIDDKKVSYSNSVVD